MKLDQQDVSLFYRLWYALVWSVNERHRVIPRFRRPAYGKTVPVTIEAFLKIRDEMWDHPQWIDEYLAGPDSSGLGEEERAIIASWRKYFIKDTFVVMKHLARYSALMTMRAASAQIYGVCGISDSLADTFTQKPPFPIDLVLLPFKNKIIYDSMANLYGVALGPSIRENLQTQYAAVKAERGILEVLDGSPPIPAPKKKKPAAKQEGAPPGKAAVPKAMRERYDEIAALITGFCDEKLDDEYKALSLHALEKLCRKRPSPLLGGKARTWACGIVYAIGSANFIFDKSQPLSMTAGDIAAWFGLAKSTAGNKGAEVARILNISYRTPEYMRREINDKNPAIWFLTYQGIVIDIRDAPYELQEKAFQAGMIPYIPGERPPR